MGRRSHARALDAWANGTRVGQWRLPTRGPGEFQYDDHWLASPEARPISLSLPITPDNVPLRGAFVESWFDNLLPDSDRIRARLQTRFRTASREAFDLLAAIGRDCAGALQLLPPDATPEDVLGIHVEPLDEAAVERVLVSAAGGGAPFGAAIDEQDEFRISIAGAQEKTALTWYSVQVIFASSVSHGADQCKAFSRSHSGPMSRGNNAAMGRSMADPQGRIGN